MQMRDDCLPFLLPQLLQRSGIVSVDVFHRFFSFAFSAPLSVQIVANRDDFRSAEFIPPERELGQHALDNSPTLFVDQPSCGLKSALLWLRLRRALSSAVDFKSRFSVQPLEGA